MNLRSAHIKHILLRCRQRCGIPVGRFCLFCLPLFSVFPASAEIYKWVDEQGKVHYGDRPPQTQASQAEPYSPNAGQNHKVSVDPETSDRQKKLLENWRQEQENQDEAKNQLESQRYAQLQAERCGLLKNMKKQYTQSGRVYRETENGARIYLTDEELAIELKKLEDRILASCENVPQ